MITSLLSLSWMDLFVPTGVSIVLVLLSVVRKRGHVLYYILGSYFTYVLASTAIFLGADIYIRKVWEHISNTYPVYIGVLKLCTGMCALAWLIFMLRYIVKLLQKKKSFSFEKVLPVKSVHPAFILLIGVGQYLIALPSCINMFAFIAILVSNDVALAEAVLYISIFCSVSILPKLVVYILSFVLEGQMFERAMEVIRRVISIASMVCIPVILLLIVAWASISGIGDIIMYK